MPGDGWDQEGAVRELLAQRYGSAASGLEFLAQGGWSRCYDFELDGQPCVIRLGLHVEDYEKDRLAGRFASEAVPIPEVLDVGVVGPGYFAISRRAWGRVLGAVTSTERETTISSLLGALDTLRMADLSATSGYGLWDATGAGRSGSWTGFLLESGLDLPGRRIHGFRERLAETVSAAETFDAAYGELRVLVAKVPNVRHLVHADLLQDNVLVEGGRLTAVLDWGCSLYGDFLYDIAWLAFSAFWFPALDGLDFVAEAGRHYDGIGLEVPGFDDRIRCYLIQIGIGAIAYNAFIGNAVVLDQSVERTRAVLES